MWWFGSGCPNPRLSPRMKLPMNLPQPPAGDMRIDLRRADARVAEQFLNDAQVRAVLQQVRGKAVPGQTVKVFLRHCKKSEGLHPALGFDAGHW